MSEQQIDDVDERDWAASDFGTADYVDGDELRKLVVEVADGAQLDAPLEPPATTAAAGGRPAFTRGELSEIAVRTGYPVQEAWVGGHGPMRDIVGVMLHHTGTADSAPGDYPTLRVVREGRSDLPGPLCNYGLGRSGTIYLVSDGRAFHAGTGSWKGITSGNTRFLGIEAENAGSGAPWPAVQLDAYQRLVASILLALGRDTNWDVRHGSWTTRKIDTRGFTMAEFDARVREMLAAPETINRNH